VQRVFFRYKPQQRRVHNAVLLAFMLCNAISFGWAGEIAGEDALKADYLLNFAKYLGWPHMRWDEPRAICLLGADGVEEVLTARQRHQRPRVRS
jgi:hypothetical protein